MKHESVRITFVPKQFIEYILQLLVMILARAGLGLELHLEYIAITCLVLEGPLSHHTHLALCLICVLGLEVLLTHLHVQWMWRACH